MEKHSVLGRAALSIALVLLLLSIGVNIFRLQTVTASSASLLLSPDISPTGATVTASGLGFTPDSVVTVTFGSPPSTLGTTTTDSTGSFSLPFLVPVFPPGTYTVSATDSSGVSASTELAISYPISGITGTTQQVTTNPAGQFNPAISGNIVTYTDLRNGNANVFYYDLSSETETQVTYATGTQEDELADVSGSTIVYTQFGPGLLGEVLGYVIGGTSNPLDIAVNPSFTQTDPSIDGSIVAWQDNRYVDFQIFAEDISTRTTSHLTPGIVGANAHTPNVSGNDVVYSEQLPNSCQVFVTNFVTNSTTQVTNTPGCAESTDISGDMVVYALEGNIHVYDLSTGTDTDISQSLPGSQQNPHVSGDWVSFEHVQTSSSGSWASIILYNILTGEYFVAAPGTSPDNSAFLSDISVSNGIGRVAYTDNALGVDHIYVFQFGLAPTTLDVLCSPNSVAVGSATNCKATIEGSGPTPTGTVSWSQSGSGAVSFSPTTCTLSSGRCPVDKVSGLKPGSVTVTATYSGDSSNEGSTGLTGLDVTKASPAIATTLSHLGIVVGQSVKDSAILEGSYHAGGAVVYEYFSGSACLGTPTKVGTAVTVTNGVVPNSASHVFGTAGSYSWKAVYTGNVDNKGATSPCEQLTVLKAGTAATHTTISCTKSSFAVGTNVTCTANVTGPYPSHTGTITWSKASGTGSVTFSSTTCTLSAGSCSVTITGAAAGSVTIQATYSGDSHNPWSSVTHVLTIT